MNAPRAWGSDRAEAAPDGTLLLECEVGKAWLARVAGSQTRSEHPGTAVEWDGELYEVLAVEALAGKAVRYRLAAWEPRHAIRRIERYDEANEAARHAASAELSTDREKRRLAILLSPIVGHLPGAVQKKMEHDFGAPAVMMTIVSTLPFLILSVVGLIAFMVNGLSGTQALRAGIFANPLVGGYFFVESALRIYSAFLQREPMGSLLGHFAYVTWTLARGRPAAPAAAPAATPTAAPLAGRALQDRYMMLEPFLALLAPADQGALERSFGFDPRRWGRTTSLLILLVAGLSVLISLFAFLSRTGGFPDLAVFVVGGFLVVEQIGRRRALADGKPAGSILGAFVRPLALPLLNSARG
jgi:hypothetical protein